MRKSGVKVRIAVQLVNAADGYHLWSETFDRDLEDIFAVRDEIASSVAEALKVKLLGDDASRLVAGGTDNAEALQAYLQGLHFRHRGSDKAASRSAIEAFERAIERDPDYAQAHAGLSGAWWEMAINNFADLDDAIPKVRAAAEKSIELAPDLADGYIRVSMLHHLQDLDVDAADNAMQTALRLNRGSAEVQLGYSRMRSLLGKHEDGIAAAKKATELDPVSMAANQSLGQALFEAGLLEEAIKAYRRALELDPHHPRPHYGIAMCTYLLGDAGTALKEIEQEPLDWMRDSGSAIILHALGKIDDAQAAKSLLDAIGDNGVYQQAQVHAHWGEADLSFLALERARDTRDPGISQMLVDPLLGPIRDDPRFATLLAEVGFKRT